MPRRKSDEQDAVMDQESQVELESVEKTDEAGEKEVKPRKRRIVKKVSSEESASAESQTKEETPEVKEEKSEGVPAEKTEAPAETFSE